MKADMNANSQTILAMDTATTGCAVCVWRDGRVLAAQSTPMARGQAEHLMPMVDAVLREAGVAPADLDAVAVTRGPGAFTGLRIALAAARGFALALGIPCVGVTTLEAIAWGVAEDERQAKGGVARTVLACVESKREDIYVQAFTADLNPVTTPMAAGPDALRDLFPAGADVVLVGDAAGTAQEWLSNGDVAVCSSTAPALPQPAIVAARAVVQLVNGAVTPPEPLYLRPPDAKLPKAQGRMRV